MASIIGAGQGDDERYLGVMQVATRVNSCGSPAAQGWSARGRLRLTDHQLAWLVQRPTGPFKPASDLYWYSAPWSIVQSLHLHRMPRGRGLLLVRLNSPWTCPLAPEPWCRQPVTRFEFKNWSGSDLLWLEYLWGLDAATRSPEHDYDLTGITPQDWKRSLIRSKANE